MCRLPNSCPEDPYSSVLALNTRMNGMLCGLWWVGGSSWFPSEVNLLGADILEPHIQRHFLKNG